MLKCLAQINLLMLAVMGGIFPCVGTAQTANHLVGYALADEEAGNGHIEGIVRDSLNRPTAGILLRLQPTGQTATTNAEGKFRFAELAPGDYTVVIEGVEPGLWTQARVKVRSAKTSEVQLRVGDPVTDMVQVIGQQEFGALYQAPDVVGTTVFAGKKNEMIAVETLDANLATNNTRQVFAKVPGLHVWENDGSGIQVGVSVRGLSPNRSWEFNVRQNGYDIATDPFGYPEAYYAPPMEAVERIEVVRGAASLQFGPQFGGLLNYVIKQAPADKKFEFESRQTGGSYGLFNTYNSVGGTVGKFSYFAFGHFRRADGWRQNSAYETMTGFARVQYRFGARAVLGLEFTRSTFESQQPGGLTDAQFGQNARQSFRARNWLSVPTTAPTLTFDWNISEKLVLSAKAFGLFSHRSSVGFTQGITIPDSVVTNPASPIVGQQNNRMVDRDIYQNFGAEVRMAYRYTLGLSPEANTLAFGVRYFNGETDRMQLGPGTNGSGYDISIREGQRYVRDMTYNSENMALFAENVFRVGRRLSIIPGARFEWLNATGVGRMNIVGGADVPLPNQNRTRTFFLAGVGAQFKTSATTNVYANFTQAYRPVLFADLVPPAQTAEIDQNLRDAKGFNADVGYRGQVKNFLAFDIGAFLLRYDDRIGTLARGKNQPLLRTNIGSSLAQGFEGYVEYDPIRQLMANPRFGTVQIFASATFQTARYISGSTNQGDSVNVSWAGKRVENAPETILRTGLTYRLKGFSLTAQYSHVGNVYSDVNNTERANASATVGRIPAYDVVDLAMNWTFRKRWTLGGGINNLLNNAYFTRRATGYPGPGLMPADGRTWFVMLGVKI